MEFILWAIEVSGSSRDGIKNRLYNAGPYDGASGTIQFDEFGETTKPYTVAVVENGKFIQHDELMPK